MPCLAALPFPNASRLPAAAGSGVSRPYEPAKPELPLCARRSRARRQIKKYARSQKISTATNPTLGLALMPLVHCSDPYEVKRSVGVRFIMQDASDLSKRVMCLVTHAALRDRATLDGHGKHWMRAWNDHHSTIEALASANYDRDKLGAEGEVLVDTDDLTPIDC
jgi:Protein of unknown function (DUF1488)